MSEIIYIRNKGQEGDSAIYPIQVDEHFDPEQLSDMVELAKKSDYDRGLKKDQKAVDKAKADFEKKNSARRADDAAELVKAGVPEDVAKRLFKVLD